MLFLSFLFITPTPVVLLLMDWDVVSHNISSCNSCPLFNVLTSSSPLYDVFYQSSCSIVPSCCSQYPLYYSSSDTFCIPKFTYFSLSNNILLYYFHMVAFFRLSIVSIQQSSSCSNMIHLDISLHSLLFCLLNMFTQLNHDPSLTSISVLFLSITFTTICSLHSYAM